MALSHGTKIVRNGLVLHLDAANPKSYPGTGTVWKDLSGNGNHGTLVNGPTYDNTNGGSVLYDGIDDELSTPTQLVNNNSASLEIWLKSPSNYGGYSRAIITKAWGVGRLWLWASTTGNITMNTYFGSGMDYYLGGGNIGSDEWHSIVLTIDRNGSQIIYVDGDYKNSRDISAASGISWNTQRELLGKYNQSSIIRYNGYFSKYTIYNRALSPQEIQQNFNALRGRYGI